MRHWLMAGQALGICHFIKISEATATSIYSQAKATKGCSSASSITNAAAKVRSASGKVMSNCDCAVFSKASCSVAGSTNNGSNKVSVTPMHSNTLSGKAVLCSHNKLKSKNNTNSNKPLINVVGTA